MIIDSSAIIAVINGEPEATQFAHAIAAAVCRISAVNYVEAAIVADNRGEASLQGAYLPGGPSPPRSDQRPDEQPLILFRG